MKESKIEEMIIDGCVDIRENPVNEDEFWELFIQWIEENNWYFGGGIRPYEKDE